MNWKSEDLYSDGDRFFSSLEEGLRRAHSSISLQTYIFATDPLGSRVVQLLKEAAGRGVSVRVMVDGIGSLGWERRFGPELAAAGVSYKVFNKVPFSRLGIDRRLLDLPARTKAFFQLINVRNHRKFCLVDGREAWLGSMNVSAVHLRSLSGQSAWRDTAVHVAGPDVVLLAASFERLWSRPGQVIRRLLRRQKATRLLNRRQSALVLLNDTKRLRVLNYRQLKSRIRRARQRILITNSYFVPPGSLLRALSYAAAHGIEVKILVPRTSDVFFMPWVASALYLGLLRAGVRVFEYLPSMLHAKTLIVDGWAVVGSSNLNHRSFLHDLEADIVLSTDRCRNELEAQFNEDLAHAEEITYEDWNRQAPFKRFLGRLALIFRFWL